MPKLSDIKIDASRFRGKGIRPWNDSNVVKPAKQNTTSIQSEPTNLYSNTKKSKVNTEQIEYKTSIVSQEKEPLAQREHSVSKPLANGEQTVSNPLAQREHSVSKPLAKALAEPLAQREHSVSKPLANFEKTKKTEVIEILVGKEKELLLFLFQKCQSIGSLESPPITTDDLKKILKINAVHLRNLIYRVLKKGIIHIDFVKKGKAGWRKFKFSNDVFQYLSFTQNVSIALAQREHSVSKPLAKALAEPLATTSSSSSIYNNINTTTSEVKMDGFLSQEWIDTDFESLSNIGFTETHLKQIASQNLLSPEIVQNSIYAFAFDLKNNGKTKSIKGSPLNYFMGVLRKGQPYNYPQNYESQQERSKRLYVERLREIEQRRVDVEKEACNLAFKEWFYALSDDEIKKLMPTGIKYTKGSKICEGAMKEYFSKEVWASKLAKIVSGE